MIDIGAKRCVRPAPLFSSYRVPTNNMKAAKQYPISIILTCETVGRPEVFIAHNPCEVLRMRSLAWVSLR